MTKQGIADVRDNIIGWWALATMVLALIYNPAEPGNFTYILVGLVTGAVILGLGAAVIWLGARLFTSLAKA